MEKYVEDIEDDDELEDAPEAVLIDNDINENPGHPEVTGQPTPE